MCLGSVKHSGCFLVLCRCLQRSCSDENVQMCCIQQLQGVLCTTCKMCDFNTKDDDFKDGSVPTNTAADADQCSMYG